MSTAVQTLFRSDDLPAPDHERLLRLLFQSPEPDSVSRSGRAGALLVAGSKSQRRGGDSLSARRHGSASGDAA